MESIQAVLKEPLPSGNRAFYAARVDPHLAERLSDRTMVFRRLAERQRIGGLMAVGKSRAKVYEETDTKVTFRDVAGVDEAKFELQRSSHSCVTRRLLGACERESRRGFC